jgi:hypothetical protein
MEVRARTNVAKHGALHVLHLFHHLPKFVRCVVRVVELKQRERETEWKEGKIPCMHFATLMPFTAPSSV